MAEQPKAPRFRFVIELSFRNADPWDPTGYPALIERLKEFLENSPDCNCSDVSIREALTIPTGDEGEYKDWRHKKGQYDPANLDPAKIGHVRAIADGPIPAVDPSELKRVWELEQQNTAQSRETMSQLIKDAETDRRSSALLARVLLLKILQSRGVFGENEKATAPTASVLQKVAVHTIEHWRQLDIESFVREISRE